MQYFKAYELEDRVYVYINAQNKEEAKEKAENYLISDDVVLIEAEEQEYKMSRNKI